MLLLLSALSSPLDAGPLAAGEPPPANDLLAASRLALREIPGCHVIEAAITRKMRLGPLRDSESYTLFGELSEGAWQGFSWVTDSDRKEGFQVLFEYDERNHPFSLPSIGVLPGGPAQGYMEGQSFLAMALESGEQPGESLAVFGEDHQGASVYALDRRLSVPHPLREGAEREVTLQVLFDRTTLRPLQWSGSLKRALPLEPVRGAPKVHDFDFQLQVDDAGLPTSERWKGKFRLNGVNLKIEQEVRYQRVGGC